MLRLNGIHKAFGSTKAVDDLTLEIREGEVFGLLGPNGAGKTTIVNIAMGLLAPDEGTVEIGDRGSVEAGDRGSVEAGDRGSPLKASNRALVGVAPQALALYEELTGRENLLFFGRLQGLSGRDLKNRVSSALEFVDLADRASDLVKKYSGGMKRRINLACALIHDPPLILLDEPTAGVDPQSRNALYDNIKALQAEGRTIIYTTHYMEEAQKLCDRVGIIDRGRLLALDSVDGLIDSHGGASVLVMESADTTERIETDDPLKALTELNRAGSLKSFRLDRPDLEQVFLNLTGRKLRD